MRACANAIGLGTPVYIDSLNYNCPGNVGKTFTAAQLDGSEQVRRDVLLPEQPRTAPRPFQPIQGGDTIWNNQEIVKLQYTKNFGSSAFLRVYGYTYYSRLAAERPADHVCRLRRLLFSGLRADLAHARRQHPVPRSDQRSKPREPSEDYTTANSIRDNNSFYARRTGGSRRQRRRSDERLLLRTDRRRPDQLSTGNAVSFGTIHSGLSSGHHGRRPESAGLVSESGRQPRTQCAYMLAENGNHATYNQVVPQFWASSLTDEFRPTDKWLFNLGVRLDSFTFNGSNTRLRRGPQLCGRTRSTSTTASTTSPVRSSPRPAP